MDLKIKDIAELLKVDEKTIHQWIKDKKIPCYKINHQYRFNKSEITEWILGHQTEFSSSLINFIEADIYNLSGLIEKGGIAYDVLGNNPAEVFKDTLTKIIIPPDLSRGEILRALLSREELMPTAIGNGIAIPHPRNPIVTNPVHSSVSICYLHNPVDFGALDGKPVRSLFILLTSTPKMHLNVLSKISYICMDKKFLDLLLRKAEKEVLLDFIKHKESAWSKK